MNEAAVNILISAQDEATPKLQGLQSTLIANRMAFRELAMGVGFMGSTFLGMGIALERTNTAFGDSAGRMLIMVGSVSMAISSSVQFISAIGKMVNALKTLQVAQILAQAFSGPTGWVSLGVGAAVAGATIAGVSAASRSSERANRNEVNINVHGSVVRDKDLAATMRQEMVKVQQQNASSGIR